MANCTYCGKPAGFLKKRHKECEMSHETGLASIISLVKEAGTNNSSFSHLEEIIHEIADQSFIQRSFLPRLVISGWEKAVEDAFDDGVLTEEEENRLMEMKDHFGLTQTQLDENGQYRKTIKGAVLREVLEGKLSERLKIDGTLPFNLQKAEKIIWVFQDVDYYEQKNRTHYVGGSQGVSFRIAKGVYYRTGAFRGERVQSTENVHSDKGLLGVTNKHLYFSGTSKSIRIAYSKIVTFEPYSDGIGVQRDTMTAKPQSFVTGDGWFTYNLITNCSNL